MIITSVVPPELPMELSLAVNTSLMALHKKSIFCTEPFRIPYGGKVNICCFDKTGTLTSDEIIMSGIACADGEKWLTQLPNSSLPQLTFALDSPIQVQMILAGCQSLVMVDRKLAGDPTERASMKAIGWSISGLDKVSKGGVDVVIRYRFPFSSSLKRMAVIAVVNRGKADEIL